MIEILYNFQGFKFCIGASLRMKRLMPFQMLAFFKNTFDFMPSAEIFQRKGGVKAYGFPWFSVEKDSV